MLLALSGITYFIHFVIFRDFHHILIYFIGDVGFLFISVLLVTLVIERLLTARDKQSLLNKLNMVIGAFFSEVGTQLLRIISNLDPGSEELRSSLKLRGDWSENDFTQALGKMISHKYEVSVERRISGRYATSLRIRGSSCWPCLRTPTSWSTRVSPSFSGPSST